MPLPLQLRDTIAPQYDSQLDQIAGGLISAFAESPQPPATTGATLPGLFTYPDATGVPATNASSSFPRAVMFDGTQPAGSQMIDLNTRIPNNPEWYLLYAWGINNSGQIVGEGRIKGEKHAFLLLPI